VNVEVWTNLPSVGASSVRRLKREEYEKLVELGHFDNERVELIRGVIVRMPPPQGAPHAGPIETLTELLVPALVGRARVRVQLPLIAPDDSVPEPDIAVVDRADHFQTHPSSAHLVIEVARSSVTYDRETKGPLYASMGVPDYWVLDVERRVLEVYRRPSGERYEEVTALRAGATVTLVAFPDVTIAVSDLLPPS
jgi:Uma2 family endonuclease